MRALWGRGAHRAQSDVNRGLDPLNLVSEEGTKAIRQSRSIHAVIPAAARARVQKTSNRAPQQPWGIGGAIDLIANIRRTRLGDDLVGISTGASIGATVGRRSAPSVSSFKATSCALCLIRSRR